MNIIKNNGLNNIVEIAETIQYPKNFTILIHGNNNEVIIEDYVVFRGGVLIFLEIIAQ